MKLLEDVVQGNKISIYDCIPNQLVLNKSQIISFDVDRISTTSLYINHIIDGPMLFVVEEDVYSDNKGKAIIKVLPEIQSDKHTPYNNIREPLKKDTSFEIKR